MDVLAIAGSLRHGSWNRRLLLAAAERSPERLRIRLYNELSAVPLFSEDLESSDPQSVARFRAQVAAADGLLIATPEYNWSIPGVLKNAIDWLSRPPAEVLPGKPVAIIGATAGRWGTRLAQAALRQVLTATESAVMPAPAMFVHEAANLFADDGRLIDAATLDQLDNVLVAFGQWIERVRNV
jgi:chromate reductase